MPSRAAVLAVLPLLSLACEPASSTGPDDATAADQGRLLDGPCIDGRYSRFATSALEASVADVGAAVLRAGGNAADATVAMSLAQFVWAFGYTTLAGPYSALVHAEATATTRSLDGSYKVPSHPSYPGNVETSPGLAVLIPGAPLALYRLQRAEGRLSWAQVVEPARAMAANGFRATAAHSFTWANNRAKLCKVPAYRRAFFRVPGTGAPPSTLEQCLQSQAAAANTLVVQDELAHTLAEYQVQGADLFYCRRQGAALTCGAWAQGFIATVNAAGGQITPADLADYQARWFAPLRRRFDRFELLAAGGVNFGAYTVLAPFAALELGRTDAARPMDLRTWGHPSKGAAPDVNTAEVLTRLLPMGWYGATGWDLPATYAGVEQEGELRQPTLEAAVDSTAAHSWATLKHTAVALGGSGGPVPIPPAGSHSSANAVIDAQGNVAVSINTINDANMYADGLAVGGVALNASARAQPALSPRLLQRGEHVPFPSAPLLLFEGGRPVLAVGTVSAAIQATNLQVVVSRIAQQAWSLDECQLTAPPRLGLSFPFPFYGAVTQFEADLLRTYPKGVLDELAGRGLGVMYPIPGVLDASKGTEVLVANVGPGRYASASTRAIPQANLFGLGVRSGTAGE